MILETIPYGVTGLFVRWEHPRVTDASIITGENVNVTQLVVINFEELKSNTHISEYFFPVGWHLVKYSMEDWAGNRNWCYIDVFIRSGKIGFFDKKKSRVFQIISPSQFGYIKSCYDSILCHFPILPSYHLV